ncbi:MAG: DM13 domain-containing protein [Anaerolineae bacterium]
MSWYLVSPLFINTVVDEAFPFELPSTDQMAQMSDPEMSALAEEFRSAMPSQDAMEGLSSADRERVTTQVMEAAAVVLPDTVMDEPMPTSEAETAMALVSGQFGGADGGHRASGTATVYRLPSGHLSLRLEDFRVINGPDLHVILSAHSAPKNREQLGEDYVDLGRLKGNIGNQNYRIPSDLDISDYASVVIYCVPFHVVFGSAALA